ncbi:hypothetical protein [Magnetospirillum fulvum]|uniref:Uncharacterized protein n=1 Tax=Magnetospirillum fulvum TaxID=1082 RepID=A0A1H6J0G8_MAGFU|nr:hypothetical protein [Magnetospirillum fulvum]SEH52283.1 hypothetical protein SAMN04244559_02781 [Magnetospirillum fulvum]
MMFKTSQFEIDMDTTGLFVRLARLGALDLTFRSPVKTWSAWRDGEAFWFSLGRVRGVVNAG